MPTEKPDYVARDEADTAARNRARLQIIITDILNERARQDTKWGPQDHHPLEWLSIETEEIGEVAKAINEAHWGRGEWAQYRRELIEVAAVAVAAVESLDRNGPPQ